MSLDVEKSKQGVAETKAALHPAEETKAEPRPAEKTKETTVVDSAVSHWTKGRALLDDQKGDEAIVEFDEAARLDPKYAQAYTDRGLAYARKGDLDRALADYNEVLRLDPKLALAYAGRGNAYAKKGDLDRAFADCKQASPRSEAGLGLQQPRPLSTPGRAT